jgi:hypothetical protein
LVVEEEADDELDDAAAGWVGWGMAIEKDIVFGTSLFFE